jgi:hypothetical protein
MELVIAASDRDAIIGDLHQEYCAHVLPARGAMRARWWYRWQVARSLAPLFLRSWERASLHRATAASIGAALCATAPAAALVMLRTFVLQQVPLKTTAEMSSAFALALLVVMVLAGALGVAAAISVLNSDSRER